MDAKLIALAFYISLAISTLCSCQKKVDSPINIVDDSNSYYAGKTCYGRSKENQYIVRTEDGSYGLFIGSRSQLELEILNQGPGPKAIRFAEQDRQLDLKVFDLDNSGESLELPRASGIYWQVWGQEDMQANILWDQQIKGQGITVAIVDAGVDQTHPALVNRLAVNLREIPGNGIDDDQNGLIDDDQGFDFAEGKPLPSPSAHGTHVAGIIAAEPKNGMMLGVAPEAKILPLSIMSPRGGGTLSAAVFAVKYAASRGAKIINASWGGAVCADTLKQMLQSADLQNVLFVAASGNDGIDIDQFPEFPAAFDLANQITVGASVQSGLMASFSNYGRNGVHILAPGHQILSTVPGGWQLASGTSMAAPFVSGLAALLWSAHPESSVTEIKSSILASVTHPEVYYPVASQGRINAAKALRTLESHLLSRVKNAELPNPTR